MSSLPAPDAAAALLLDAALRGTLVLAAAFAVTRAMRRAPAASRHLVWVVALASVVALPALGALLPAWRVVPVPAFLRAAAPASSAVVPGPASPEAPPASTMEPASASSPDRSDAADHPMPPSPSAATQAAANASAQPNGLPVDWRTAALLLWAAGGALLVLRLGYGVARVWWMERGATEITDEQWVRTVDTLARKLRVGRMVTLLREARAQVPMTWGVIRPVVLLPAGAERWSLERRTVVLAHELAHVRRWDTLTQWVAHLALALFWFHPLVWAAARRMREERERACDDAVLELGTTPVTYADHLLDIVRSLGSAEGPVAALAMARRSQFEGRLLAILDAATPRGGVSGALAAAALGAAAVCLLPLAALRAAPEPVAAAVAAAPVEAGRESAPEAPVSAGSEEAPGLLGRVGGRVDALLGREEKASPDLPAFASAETSRAASSAPAAAPPSVQAAARADTGDVLVELATEIESEGARARFLVGAAQQEGRDAYLDVIRAAESIGSSDERRMVLMAVLERPGAGPQAVAAAVRATRGMDSDTNKRHVLLQALERSSTVSPALSAALLEAVGTFTSGTERRYVLMALLNRPRLAPATVLGAIEAVKPMDSDTEKRYVLTTAAQTQRVEGRAHQAYLEAVRTMDSDDERSYALTALVQHGGSAAAPPARAARAASPAPPARVRQAGTWEADLRYTGDRLLTIQARKVVRGDAADEVADILPGGRLFVEERTGGVVRSVEMLPAGGGGIRRVYRVGGELREWDAAAQRWLAGILRQLT
jgi:beta-lactamase regulating signal transducer with metallopeptidase domain/uncharacterized protein (DUF1778 family)